LKRELDVARDLARKAGAVILDHYKRGFEVEYKGKGDPVTQADKDANVIIVDGLRAAFPDDGVLAEESGGTDERRSRRRLWCVDPLDGTQEFIERNGQFVVMIGLAVLGEAVAGVVYQPTEDTLWFGSGERAFVEKDGVVRSLQPSREIDPRRAVLVGSRSHVSQTVTEIADILGVARVDRVGSVGLKMARVASAEADIYLSASTRTHEWDACAPEAILRAAGGRVSDTYGDPLRYNKAETNTPRGMLATNGLVHAAVVRAARPYMVQRF
jgi:3'(2'), 5'-bisphosphate nucleotidase